MDEKQCKVVDILISYENFMWFCYSANVVIMFCVCRSITICINTDTSATNNNLNEKAM